MSSEIKHDTTAIRAELAALRMQVLQLQPSTAGQNFMVQRFLNDTLTYTESVIDPFETTCSSAEEEVRDEDSKSAEQSSVETPVAADLLPKPSVSVRNPPTNGEVGGGTWSLPSTEATLAPSKRLPRRRISPARSIDLSTHHSVGTGQRLRHTEHPNSSNKASSTPQEAAPPVSNPGLSEGRINRSAGRREGRPHAMAHNQLRPKPEAQKNANSEQYSAQQRTLSEKSPRPEMPAPAVKPTVADPEKAAAAKIARKKLTSWQQKALDDSLGRESDPSKIENWLSEGALLCGRIGSERYVLTINDIKRFGMEGAAIALQYGLRLSTETILAEYWKADINVAPDLKLVRFLLGQGADVNAVVCRGFWAQRFDSQLSVYAGDCSAFHVAVLTKATYLLRSRLISLLLSFGADLEQTTSLGYKPLQLAIRRGDILAIAQLSNAGARRDAFMVKHAFSLWRSSFKSNLQYGLAYAQRLAERHGLKLQSVEHQHLLSFQKCRKLGCSEFRSMFMKANNALVEAYQKEVWEALR